MHLFNITFMSGVTTRIRAVSPSVAELDARYYWRMARASDEDAVLVDRGPIRRTEPVIHPTDAGFGV